MIIKLLIEGGDMKPGPAISQKLGPLGINIGKVIQDINKASQNFKGLKVPVELDVNPKAKTYEIKVFSPPVSEMIKKELSLQKGSGVQKKLKVGNLAIEQVIKIALTKFPNMLASNLKAAVKNVVGSCVSLGVLVETKDPKEIEKEIVNGFYDTEINSEKTQASAEKLAKLIADFNQIKSKQDEQLKKEEAEKAAATAAAEAAKAAAPPAATAPVPGAPAAAPAAGKTPAATAAVKPTAKK